MRRADAVEDLLVLARDRELSDEDSARLGRAVESSLELKLLLDAGYGCDAQTRLLPGDEAKMQRLVERVMQQVDAGAVDGEMHSRVAPVFRERIALFRERIALRRARPMLLAAAACLLPVGMAVAWQVAQRSTGASSLHTTVAASASAPSGLRTPPRLGRPGKLRHATEADSDAAPVPREPSVGVLPPVEAADSQRPDAPRSQPHSIAPSRPAELSTQPRGVQSPAGRGATAAELFAGANLARREGKLERAVQLYEQLIRAYPDSMEAADAHTVLGKLELDRAPASAVWQFRQSRARGSTAEALWGEAESLRRMASPEERTVLERIVREFPNSPYAPAARARLVKLAP